MLQKQNTGLSQPDILTGFDESFYFRTLGSAAETEDYGVLREKGETGMGGRFDSMPEQACLLG